jgi:hypothetical protein
LNRRHYESVLELRKGIIRYLVNNGYWEYGQPKESQEYIYIAHLKEAIRVLKCKEGSNLRTQRKTIDRWIHDLKMAGILKESTKAGLGAGNKALLCDPDPNFAAAIENQDVSSTLLNWQTLDNKLLSDDDLQYIQDIKDRTNTVNRINSKLNQTP